MNIIILVVSVVGAFFIYKMAAFIIAKWFPQTFWAKLIYTLVGLGLGLVYIYFAGYYIMSKEANTFFSLVIAFAPWVIYIASKVVTRANLIEK